MDDKGAKEVIKWKGRPAHEAARWMLESDPWGYLVALATMYGTQKVIVPPKEIPTLVSAFEMAKKIMIEHIDQAIAVLEEQQKEAQKKQEEKEAG